MELFRKIIEYVECGIFQLPSDSIVTPAMNIFERFSDKHICGTILITVYQAGFVNNCQAADAMNTARLLMVKHHVNYHPYHILQNFGHSTHCCIHMMSSWCLATKLISSNSSKSVIIVWYIMAFYDWIWIKQSLWQLNSVNQVLLVSVTANCQELNDLSTKYQLSWYTALWICFTQQG